MLDYPSPFDYKRRQVLVLDLDHTIIGDIGDLSDMRSLYSKINWSPQIRAQLFKVDEELIYRELKDGLLRPGVEDFINYVRRDYGDLIVVFTLSKRSWATMVLNAINRLLGYQFYALLLTREDCDEEGFKDLKIVCRELSQLGIDREESEIKMYDDKMTNDSPRLKLCPPYRYGPRVKLEDYFPLEIVAKERDRVAINYFIFQIKEWGYATPNYLRRLGFSPEGIKKREITDAEAEDYFFDFELFHYS